LPEPIRLKIAYQRPESALGEFTRSVSRRTVSLRSPKKVEPGTEFVFELFSKGMAKPVEVRGKVERVLPLGKEFLLTIRYEPSGNREWLDLVLAELKRLHQDEKKRVHLRVPLNLPAQADLPYSPSFVIRDLSRGGMGVSVEAPELPPAIKPGELVLAELTYGKERLILYGSVVWAASTSPDAQRALYLPGFGVRFGKLRPATVIELDRMLSLEVLPPPSIQARLSFGKDAMARMP
jgi:hypothetical protein